MILLSGCAVAGVAAYKFSGPPAVPAKYAPSKETMVVLVENYRFPTAGRTDSEQIGKYIYEELREHDVAPLKSPDDLFQLRAANPEKFHKMKIGEVGQALGAGQVLYVNLTQSSVDQTTGTEMLKGKLNALVKIVDSRSGATLWPKGASDGYPISVETPFVQAKPGIDEIDVRQQMYQEIAGNISRMFYAWKPDSLEKQDEGRLE